MKIEEAIDVLENGGWWELLIPVTTIEGRIDDIRLHEAIDIAINALKNQKNGAGTNVGTSVEDEIFCQCAEECAELAQACLKMRRVLHGTTLADKNKIRQSIGVEIADVLNCIEVILENDLADVDVILKSEKMLEFKKRLRKINGEEA